MPGAREGGEGIGAGASVPGPSPPGSLQASQVLSESLIRQGEGTFQSHQRDKVTAWRGGIGALPLGPEERTHSLASLLLLTMSGCPLGTALDG